MEKRMMKLKEFLNIYRLYRQIHSPAYAARIAWGVVFIGLPF
jgi:hypothetical protein